jgi:6-phosphogluconolactonase
MKTLNPYKSILFLIILKTLILSLAINAQQNKNLLFVGTYTEDEGWVVGKANGIYVYEFDTVTGQLNYVSTSVKIKNPSFVAVHPNKEYLYAVSETSGNEKSAFGEVCAFKINTTSKQLELINCVPSQGKSPCYISIEASGKHALVANYGSGTVAAFPILVDGKLSEASSIHQHQGNGPHPRQEAPHAHMIIPSPENNFFFSVDLGTDQIIPYTLNTDNGILTPLAEIKVLSGAGPRQLTFHPNKKWAYLISELNGTVSVFDYNTEKGSLIDKQSVSTINNQNTGFAGSADIRVSPDGKYLYATNRSNMNDIAMYTINQTDGTLILIGHIASGGKTPRYISFDPSGKFLLVANQDSGNVVVFKYDKQSGTLVESGIVVNIPTPVCLKFL